VIECKSRARMLESLKEIVVQAQRTAAVDQQAVLILSEHGDREIRYSGSLEGFRVAAIPYNDFKEYFFRGRSDTSGSTTLVPGSPARRR